MINQKASGFSVQASGERLDSSVFSSMSGSRHCGVTGVRIRYRIKLAVMMNRGRCGTSHFIYSYSVNMVIVGFLFSRRIRGTRLFHYSNQHQGEFVLVHRKGEAEAGRRRGVSPSSLNLGAGPLKEWRREVYVCSDVVFKHLQPFSFFFILCLRLYNS